ncbi:hypothetical protein PLEOSDRAFT_1086487 [Pleurotus ostreatus PC15]|uniref:F-box domain-containing protein n=1 Tax=Pleurotus ostreatus (strain PC15) TaxID=1137138 RepID=A0A067N7T1_PLEO1|nr:hypothetical protein PLEOSDRAFT_1086487 [Pleurotus ostreatus PC15]
MCAAMTAPRVVLMISKRGEDAAANAIAARLPIELIYLVISSLRDADDLPATLSACSLVCRSWNEICRPHIFHTVVIGRGRWRWNIDSRVSVLLPAPHLSEYIHNLSLCIPCIDCLVGCRNPDLVGRFKNLCALRLEHGEGGDLHLGMQHGEIAARLQRYQPPTFSLVPALLAAPCLQKLTLSRWTFLNSSNLYPLLEPCSKTLEHLSFEATFIQNDVQGTATPPCMNALRSLDFPPRFHPRIECPHLQTLSIRVGDREYWVLPSWIPSTLRTLTLHATPRGTIPNLGEDIRPSDFTLYLYGSCRYSRFVNWARNCISRLPFPEHLRRLTIDFEVEATWSDWSVHIPERGDYENLSQVLQKLRERCPLERIDLNVTVNVTLSGDLAASDWKDETRGDTHMSEEALRPLLDIDILHLVYVMDLQRKIGGEVLSAVRWRKGC